MKALKYKGLNLFYTVGLHTYIVPKLLSYDTAYCLVKNKGFERCHFLWSKLSHQRKEHHHEVRIYKSKHQRTA